MLRKLDHFTLTEIPYSLSCLWLLLSIEQKKDITFAI